MFGHPVYFLGGPGPSIAISGPHEEFFDSSFGIWIGGKYFLGELFIPIRIRKNYGGP